MMANHCSSTKVESTNIRVDNNFRPQGSMGTFSGEYDSLMNQDFALEKGVINLDQFESHLISKIRSSQNTDRDNISISKRESGDDMLQHFSVQLPHSNAKLSKSVKAKVSQPIIMNREEIHSFIRPSMFDHVRE
jgi:hypothetical protein